MIHHKEKLLPLNKMSEKTFRYIALTGAPGSGKTTLVKKVCQSLEEKKISISGFFTEEIRSEGKTRIGFDVVSLNGERAPLARVKSDKNIKSPFVGKYAVDVKSFESCALPLLSSYNKNSVLVLDEIGKMELMSAQFKMLVHKCIDSKKGIILMTVPLKSSNPIPLVELIRTHPDTVLLTVDRENRDHLEDKIIKYIDNAKRKESSAGV